MEDRDDFIRQRCADSTCTIDSIIYIVRRKQVNEVNQGRISFSEYHYLFPILKRHNDKFQCYMRMKLSTFEYILSRVNSSLKKNWCNLHKQPIQPEKKLVVTLRFLASGVSYSDLSFAFLMGKSTICVLINDVLQSLWKELCPIHMPIPTKDTFMDIAQDYYLLWDMPHCTGAIDVRHIRIKKPSNSGSLYYNYKKFHSITLQGVADAHNKFITIDVGGYGHQHDATTFRYSSLYKALKSKRLQIPEEDELYNCHTVLPYFFIGDGAYPMSKNLIKPYAGRNLTYKQTIFNKRLSRARISIECAFGRLCQKWRIFYKPIEQQPKKAELIVKASCILHNIIIDLEKPNNILFPQLRVATSVLQHDEREIPEILNGDGEIIRFKLQRFFEQNPIE